MPSSASLLSRVGLLLKRKGVDLAKKGVFGFGQEIGNLNTGVSLSNIRLSTDSLYLIWRNHSDVFAAVRELMQNTCSAGYKWENNKNPDQDPDMNQVLLAEKLLTFNTTFRRLKTRLVQDQQIAGNSYLLIQKSKGNSEKILGVQPIDPRTLSVITDNYGVIKKWVQRVGANTQEFSPEEILHWKSYQDPNSPVFGLSPIEPIVWEIRTDLAAMISNYAFFVNDAQPAAQYIMEEGISDEQAVSAVKMLQEQLKGAENRHKSLMLKGVKEIKQLSISQKDMEFHVLRRFTTEKVCATFGVPKSILNYTEDVNLANGQEQTQKFWEGTIAPLQEDFAEFVNKEVLPALGIDAIKIVFNERKFDSKEWTEASSRADLQLGVTTINETRKRRGLEPFSSVDAGEWVDKPIIYSGMGVRPVSDVGIDSGNSGPAIVNEAAANKTLMMLDQVAERFIKDPYAKS